MTTSPPRCGQRPAFLMSIVRRWAHREATGEAARSGFAADVQAQTPRSRAPSVALRLERCLAEDGLTPSCVQLQAWLIAGKADPGQVRT
jgi:hypothetical protein